MRNIFDIDRLLDEYTTYLLLEKGLSDNTREGFRRDVARMLSWLAGEAKPLREVTLDLSLIHI